MEHPIVIVGAGIGGLSAAIRLAAAGRRVIILEKNDALGGKMSEIRADGFRWDTGPSVITMRHVFEELFATANRNLSDYLTLEPLEPLTRYFYQNGRILDVVSDRLKMAAQIEQIEPRDVEGWFRFLETAARLHRITGPVFIYDSKPTPASFLKVPFPDWFRVDALRSMQRVIESHVRSPELRQLFGRFATYVGGSPYQAPGTLNVIAHVELTGGVWYPRGGIFQIARAMSQLARELGVEIHTNCTVKQILTENGDVVSIALADGTKIATRHIISNLDVTTTYRTLLNKTAGTDRRLKRLLRQKPSGSGFVLLLGVEGETPAVAHHNVWFSADYAHEFNQIFRDGIPPDDPTIYAAITSKTDPFHAPAGCENWFILVNAPAYDQQFNWQKNAGRYRDLILKRLAAHGTDLRDRIMTEKILTPHDLAEMSGAHRGALYGASANSRWTAFLRPHNRCPDINGLYFAGGTTHPGGGVPMVTLSGKITANLLLEDTSKR